MERLQKILDDFKVDATVMGVTKGCRIFRYEVMLADGVRISKLARLVDDIALRLGAKSVRITAIPEKQMVGVEVPRDDYNGIIN